MRHPWREQSARTQMEHKHTERMPLFPSIVARATADGHPTWPEFTPVPVVPPIRVLEFDHSLSSNADCTPDNVFKPTHDSAVVVLHITRPLPHWNTNYDAVIATKGQRPDLYKQQMDAHYSAMQRLRVASGTACDALRQVCGGRVVKTLLLVSGDIQDIVVLLRHHDAQNMGILVDASQMHAHAQIAAAFQLTQHHLALADFPTGKLLVAQDYTSDARRGSYHGAPRGPQGLDPADATWSLERDGRVLAWDRVHIDPDVVDALRAASLEFAASCSSDAVGAELTRIVRASNDMTMADSRTAESDEKANLRMYLRPHPPLATFYVNPIPGLECARLVVVRGFFGNLAVRGTHCIPPWAQCTRLMHPLATVQWYVEGSGAVVGIAHPTHIVPLAVMAASFCNQARDSPYTRVDGSRAVPMVADRKLEICVPSTTPDDIFDAASRSLVVLLDRMCPPGVRGACQLLRRDCVLLGCTAPVLDAAVTTRQPAPVPMQGLMPVYAPGQTHTAPLL
jgi:hypothetical protein